MTAFLALLKRDVLLALRQSTDLGMILGFFVIAAALFPFGVGPNPEVLARLAPGITWVLALLAVMLSLDRLFQGDYEDGTLEQLALSPMPLSMLVLAKALAHWLTACVPLIAVAPLIALMLNLPAAGYGVLIAGLALGTPSLSLIGAVGAALALGARKAGLLVAVLVLPLYIPVLVFGVTAVDAHLTQIATGPHFLYLGAILAAAIPLAPWAAAAAIRHSVS
ncbi:heme exporter protein CcmB [Marivibrio halodurans]|uniref:Heme exporter protein B n=1 Tax=Marivibrio halodurans TaxID=2039722 RepID=A0A8J7SJY2_9PROT|nr:heme exporter protein CcmB [Marivibrio halodurans]MBP5858068.1 heme exporter protein CcmB [Marivibrio halodurans]